MFKVGDRVIDVVREAGGVIADDHYSEQYKYRVNFDCGGHEAYTSSGKYVNSDKISRLHPEGTTITINKAKVKEYEYQWLFRYNDTGAYALSMMHYKCLSDAVNDINQSCYTLVRCIEETKREVK